MIFFLPAQPSCYLIPKYLLSWAYSTWNELGVLALFLADTCHRIFHHHRQQLALICTLDSRGTGRSVMEWAGRTNYPLAPGSELISSVGSCYVPATTAGPARWMKEEFSGGWRRNLFYEAVQQEYWGRSGHGVGQTKLLNYDHQAAITPNYLTPSHLSLSLEVSSYNIINPVKASALSAFFSPVPEPTLFILIAAQQDHSEAGKRRHHLS